MALVMLPLVALGGAGCLGYPADGAVATPAAPGNTQPSRLPQLLSQLQAQNGAGLEVFDSGQNQVLAAQDASGKSYTDPSATTPTPTATTAGGATPTSTATPRREASTPTPRPGTATATPATSFTPTPTSTTSTATPTATPTGTPTATPTPTPSGPPTEGSGSGGTPPHE